MDPLFAHHGPGLMESIDFLHLDPVTPLEHAVAFGVYGSLLAVVALVALKLTGLTLSRRGRSLKRSVDA